MNYHYKKGYHKWCQELLGLASYKNYGQSGHKISDCINKVNACTDNPDVIFVMIGVNDENFSTPLGTATDKAVGTIYGGYDVLCKTLKEKFPTKLVVLITPHYQTKYPHNTGTTSYEVSKAMKEIAEKYALPVYDNYRLSGIYPTNLNYWTTDNCHWNDKAHEMVGKNLSKYMIDTFRYLTDGTKPVEPQPPTPTKTLERISVIYSGGDMPVGTALAALTGLAVTAHYSDGSSNSVTGYQLSGSIAKGANTITVTYQSKTSTFVINGIEPLPVKGIKNINATIKKADFSTNTHIALLVKVGRKNINTAYKVEALVNSVAKPGGYCCPWKYALIENLRKGIKTGIISNGAKVVMQGNNLSIEFESLSLDSDYVAFPLPFSATNLPFNVNIENLKIMENGVEIPILAIGNYADNSHNEIMDFTTN